MTRAFDSPAELPRRERVRPAPPVPQSLSVQRVLALQRTAGNAAVARLLARTPDAQAPPAAAYDVRIESPTNVNLNVTLRHAPVEEATRALRRFLAGLRASAEVEHESHERFRRMREESYVAGAVSDLLGSRSATEFFSGGVTIPDPIMWREPLRYLDIASAALDTADINGAVTALRRAEDTYTRCHREYTAYRLGTIEGAERAQATLEVTAAAGAVAATIATGGAAAAAGYTLAGTAAATGLVAGSYAMTQTSGRQVAEVVLGERSDFDMDAILRRGATEAATAFVGTLLGGALSQRFLSRMGSYLGREASEETLRELGRLNNLPGPMPRDYFVTHGQRLLADALSGVATTPVTEAVTAVINRATGGGGPRTATELVEHVVQETVRGGIVQLLLGAIMHGSARPRSAHAEGAPRAAGERTALAPPAPSERPGRAAGEESLGASSAVTDPEGTRPTDPLPARDTDVDPADDRPTQPDGTRDERPTWPESEPNRAWLQHVNPEYGQRGFTNNCMRAALATDAMLAGQPARALPVYGSGYPTRVARTMLRSLFGSPPRMMRTPEIISELRAAGPRARGIVLGHRRAGAGHVFNVVNDNGVVRFIDGQSGGSANPSDFHPLELVRTDEGGPGGRAGGSSPGPGAGELAGGGGDEPRGAHRTGESESTRNDHEIANARRGREQDRAAQEQARAAARGQQRRLRGVLPEVDRRIGLLSDAERGEFTTADAQTCDAAYDRAHPDVKRILGQLPAGRRIAVLAEVLRRHQRGFDLYAELLARSELPRQLRGSDQQTLADQLRTLHAALLEAGLLS